MVGGPNVKCLGALDIAADNLLRIMVRTVSYCLHGLIPASCLAADRYNREDVVRSLSNEISLHPLLQLGQLPSTSDELLKLDQKALILCVPVFMQIFIKSELKVGVLYVKENTVDGGRRS
uniref:Uncharacterized protein n=1 Tax=Strigamia maritima TaxID=126957 RepID=T1JLJ5_STRMM